SERYAKRTKLRLKISCTDAKDQPSAGEFVQAGQLFRQYKRVALGQNDDARSQANLACVSREKRQRDDRVENAILGGHRRRGHTWVGKHDMLTCPQRLEPG